MKITHGDKLRGGTFKGFIVMMVSNEVGTSDTFHAKCNLWTPALPLPQEEKINVLHHFFSSSFCSRPLLNMCEALAILMLYKPRNAFKAARCWTNQWL